MDALVVCLPCRVGRHEACPLDACVCAGDGHDMTPQRRRLGGSYCPGCGRGVGRGHWSGCPHSDQGGAA